jgi:SAM-dependent methyltransferase
MRAPAQAFDAVADVFDQRFGAWRSVAAQRRAVRGELLLAFPQGSSLLEIGGGTGDDAAWMTRQGRTVFLTDASPAMVQVARQRLGERAVVCPAEQLHELDEPLFDGAFSNFAALNCVPDLRPVASGLQRLVRPGGRVVLVLFGTCPPGEVIVQLLRRDVPAAFRRRQLTAPARLGGREFVVHYHRPREVIRAMAPWFRFAGRRGIGVCVPPSAAEPWISAHPHLLGALAAIDRAVARPLAWLGDHVAYRFERVA